MLDFKAFFIQKLLPHLSGMESGRRQLSLVMIFSLFLGIVGLLASVYFIAGFHDCDFDTLEKTNFISALLLLVGWSVVGVLIYKKVFFVKLQQRRAEFKKKVIQEIVKFVDPSLSYFEHKLISRDEYESSKLFPVAADQYYGEDYMFGRNDQVSYKFSELHTQFIMKDHRGRKAFYTIFKGLFFIANLKEKFSSHTIILPDTAQKYFGPLGKFVNQWNIFRDEVVEIKHTDFDKEFVVYSNNSVETKKLLTDQLAQRITDFKKKTGHKVMLSFVDNKVNVAIPMNKDLFEPPVFGTMLNYDLIHENYQYISLIVGIIDDLGLGESN